MTKQYDAAQIAEELRDVSPDVGGSGAHSVKKDGVQPFMIWTSRLLTTDEMVLLCQKLAEHIRRQIPERPDGWAVRILAGNKPAVIMGDYYFGWSGHADEWELREGQELKSTDQADWQAFHNHLRTAVAALGTEEAEAGSKGDFKLADGNAGSRRHALFINNPEFLTKALIATIQKLLKDNRPDGVVKLYATFGEPFEILWDGVDVRSDSVEERWDRRKAKKLLGKRLKI